MARFDSLNDAFQALAELDPGAVDDARNAASMIAGHHQTVDDPAALSLANLLRWLWCRLPVEGVVPVQDRSRVLAHTARLFEVLDRPRHVAWIRSEKTAALIAAWDEEPGPKAEAAFLRALASSGVEAPSLDDFVWSDYLGPVELAANDHVELALERAIDDGRMTPGARGWRAVAAQVARTALHEEVPDAFGQRWIDLVVTERVGGWVDARGPESSTARVRGSVANQVLLPIEPPAGVDDLLHPLRWFCQRVGSGGAKLTARGYVDRSFVQDAATVLRSELPGRGAPRSEADLPALTDLRELAVDSGLVRAAKGRLALTSTGTAAADTGAGLWELAVAHLPGRAPFDRAAFEFVAIRMLLDDTGCSWRDACVLAAALLGEGGWRSTYTGEPTAEDDVVWAVMRARRLLDVFGGFEYVRGSLGTLRFTPAGRALALAIVRANAAGPRRRSSF